MVVLNYITFILVAIGAINWGLVGIFNFNLVDYLFGTQSVVSKIVYIVVFASALWLIASIIIGGGLIAFA